MATWPHGEIQVDVAATLNQQLRTLNARPTIPNPARITTAHLSMAAAIRVEDLLGEWVLPNTIKQIDALASLGFTGVMVQISAPILDATVPNFMAYRSFYSGVVAAVRARGLKLLVETPFVMSQREFGGSFDYSQYRSTVALFAAVHRHVRYVAEALAPDWLVVAQEPDTGAVQADREITNKQWITFVTQVTEAIDASPAVNRNVTKLAAGIGAWGDQEFVEAYAALPTLDAIDFHYYPIASTVTDYMERLGMYADMARAAGKRVTLSELGFHPQSKSEVALDVPRASQIFLRDCYLPFTPERVLSMRVFGAFMRTYNTAFGAWAYTRQLWGAGGLPYNDETDNYGLPRAEAILNREAVDAWNADPRIVSEVGRQWSALATEMRPSAAQQTPVKHLLALKHFKEHRA